MKNHLAVYHHDYSSHKVLCVFCGNLFDNPTCKIQHICTNPEPIMLKKNLNDARDEFKAMVAPLLKLKSGSSKFPIPELWLLGDEKVLISDDFAPTDQTMKFEEITGHCLEIYGGIAAVNEGMSLGNNFLNLMSEKYSQCCQSQTISTVKFSNTNWSGTNSGHTGIILLVPTPNQNVNLMSKLTSCLTPCLKLKAVLMNL